MFCDRVSEITCRPVAVGGALVVCLCVVLCAPQKEIPPAVVTSVPTQEVTNAELFLFDGSRKAWKLESAVLQRTLDEKGTTLGYPVKLTLYDSLGAARSVCLADSGITNERRDAFEVWGNVFVKNEEGTVVRAHRLRWDGTRHTVTSDSFVEITTAQGDVMRGKGLDATESFSRWSFRSDVSGHFPHFRRRMDEEAQFFGTSSPAATKRPPPSRATTEQGGKPVISKESSK